MPPPFQPLLFVLSALLFDMVPPVMVKVEFVPVYTPPPRTLVELPVIEPPDMLNVPALYTPPP